MANADNTVAAEVAVLTALEDLTKSSCFTSANRLIVGPDSDELKSADQAYAANPGAARSKHGLIVGPEASVAASYGDGTIVARSAADQMIYLVGTADDKVVAVSLKGFPTPDGNLVWVELTRTFATSC